MDIDGSFELKVERNGWGDIVLVLHRHDLRISLDPADAARVCRDIQAGLGGVQARNDDRAA